MEDPRLASMSPEELRTAMRTLGYRTQSDLAAAGIGRNLNRRMMLEQFLFGVVRGR